MLKKAFSKKRKWIIGAVSGAVAVTVFATGVLNPVEQVVAKASLPKVESYNQANDLEHPFTILEIVPSYDKARIGYLVSGQEPAYYDEYGVKALADMGSSAERAYRYPTTIDSFSDDTNTHNFAAFEEFSKLETKPFSWSDYDENSDSTKTKRFNVYGNFVEVQNGDYIDNRFVDETYKLIVDTSKDPKSETRLAIADVLDSTNPNTSHAIYTDDVLFTTSDAALPVDNLNAVNLTFKRVENANDDESIPFRVTFNVSEKERNYYSWNYYLLNGDKLQVKPLEEPEAGSDEGAEDESGDDSGDGTAPVARYELDEQTMAKFDQKTVTPLYREFNGDEYTYWGYVWYNSEDSNFYFTDVEKIVDPENESNKIFDTVKVNDIETADSLAKRIDISGYNVYTVKYFDAKYDSNPLNERLFVKDAVQNTNGTAVVFKTLYDKNLKVMAGEDAGTYFIDMDDDLTYHEFYYLPANIDEYVFYIDSADDKHYRNGTVNFVSSFKQADLIETIEYNNGFSNNEWFKQYVLDLVYSDVQASDDTDEDDDENLTVDECSNYYIDVVTKLASEVRSEDVFNADLVYIQGGTYNNDLDPQVAIDILRVLREDATNKDIPYLKPVVLEGNALYNGTVGANSGNLNKLAIALLQPNLTDEDIRNIIDKWQVTAVFDSMKASMTTNMIPTLQAQLANKDISDQRAKMMYTVRSLFVVNGAEGGCAISGDFFRTISNIDNYTYSVPTSDGTDTVDVSVGFGAVKSDIEKELFYLSVAKKGYDQAMLKRLFNDEISIATCIRHIINYGNRRNRTKSEIRVLDLEPFYSQAVEDNAKLNEGNPENIYFNDIYFYDNDGKLVTAFDGRDGDGNSTGNLKFSVYDSDDRDIFSKTWFIGSDITQISEKDIKVKGMGTREFIGNIDDLNASYDLIYIGLDTQYMNTEMTELSDGRYKKTKNTVFNDSSLNNLVYMHVGDQLNVDTQRDWYGSTMNDTFAQNATKAIRGSGTDITFEKLRDLMCYVEAGYAVILSDDFYQYDANGNITDVNAVSVDSDGNRINGKIQLNSNMYDFAKWILDKGYIGKNVTLKHCLSEDSEYPFTTYVAEVTEDNKELAGDPYALNRDDFRRYLNISKLKATIVEKDNQLLQPTSYFTGVPGRYEYLKMNSDGVYTLDFTVNLSNDDAVDTSHTTYDCKLFIDHDADGRFETVESLDGLIIQNVVSGEYMSKSDGVYNLTTGATYSITRRVPEGYIGFLPWKLVFYENGRNLANTTFKTEQSLVKYAISGYSAVPDFTNKPEIKILQITSSPQTDGADMEVRDRNELMTSLDLKNDPELVAMYKEVKDFDIKVSQLNTYQLVVNPNGEYYTPGHLLEYLMSYDMVVMGFYDDFNLVALSKDENNIKYSTASQLEAFVMAIRQYVMSGKSMLFTHDLNNTNLVDSVQELGKYYTDNYLRDLQGMDRYGVTQAKLNTLNQNNKYTLTEYKSRYDNDTEKNIFGNIVDKSTSNGSLIDNYGMVIGQAMRFHFTGGQFIPLGYSETCFDNTNGFYNFISYRGLGARGNDAGENAKAASLANKKYVLMSSSNGGPWSPLGENNVFREPSRDWWGNIRKDADGNTIYTDRQYYYYEYRDDVVNQFVSNTITKVNSGQITEYPFHMPDDTPITIAPTHPQYFQLNLDTDSQDENYNDDIVVWYTISNQDSDNIGFYTVDYNDVRNNYYIYSKGNVTYTGAGHSPVTGTEEKQLFVNTLVAAYNAGDHAPVAKYRQFPREMASDITTMYEPYDKKIKHLEDNGEGEFVEGEVVGGKFVSTLDVHFKVINNNLQNNVEAIRNDDGEIVGTKYKDIKAEYFVECDKESTGAILYNVEIKNPGTDDEERIEYYYRKINPANISLKKVTEDLANKTTVATDVTDINTLENYAIYTAKINIDELFDRKTVGDKQVLNTIENQHSAKIHIRLSMDTKVVDMSKPTEVIPATDSLSTLTINFAELYNLK